MALVVSRRAAGALRRRAGHTVVILWPYLMTLPLQGMQPATARGARRWTPVTRRSVVLQVGRPPRAGRACPPGVLPSPRVGRSVGALGRGFSPRSRRPRVYAGRTSAGVPRTRGGYNAIV